MRCLERNKTDFEYLPYDGTETDLNDDGEHTGEFHPAYGTAVQMRGNISAPSGKTNQTFYGENIRYSHVLVMDDPSTEINEFGLIRWKANLYDIVAVHPSLNFVSIALRQQTKDHPDPEPDSEPTPEPEPEPEPGSEGDD